MTSLLELRGISRHFPLQRGWGQRPRVVPAVSGVSFALERGESVGLIGASGSGKSTIARLITGLETPDDGDILFQGASVLQDTAAERLARRRHIQLVPQDSSSSLNPRLTVGRQIAAPMLRLGIVADQREARFRTAALLERVGLAASDAARLPHEFSGGQRQRINIARTLGTKADFVILDEPTSALDVSIQASILDLLREIRAEYGLTSLFIGHNLAVVQSFCDRILVLDQGQLVDDFPSQALGATGRHAAVRRLIAAVLPIRPAVSAPEPVQEPPAPTLSLAQHISA